MAKYNINVAGIELNVISSQPPETVNMLTEMLNARTGDIIVRSPRISKSEAAILCALDFGLEQLKCQEATKTAREQLSEAIREIEKLRDENRRLFADLDDLRRANRVLSDIITKSVSNKSVPADVPAPSATAETDKQAPIVEQRAGSNQLSLKTDALTAGNTPSVPAASEVMFKNEPQEEDDLPPAPKVRRRTPMKSGNGDQKNKVGDMFDMLTFKDI